MSLPVPSAKQGPAIDTDPPRRPLNLPGMSWIARSAVTILAIFAVALMVIELTRFFMLVFAAIVLAVIFDVLTSWVSRISGLSRGVALTFAVLALLGVFLGTFVLFGAQMVQEFDTIRDSIPRAIDGIEATLDRFGIGTSVRDLIDKGSSDVSSLMSKAGGYALAATSGLADFVLVFVGAIFLASNPAVYRRGLILLMPKRAEETAAVALDDASGGLRGWMIGQALSSLIVTALTWTGLAVLGVPAAGGLAVIAGLLDVIPMLGPIIAGIPAVLLAFTISPQTALWTIALFLVVQQLQGNFLQPMIQKQAVNVPPAVLLFAVVGFGILFGTLGVLLAAPLTVVSYVMVQRIYVKTLLGKDIEVAGRG